MTSNAGDAHIDTLPPELLQSVWGHLSFFDLIRCQQVCRSWKAYLPGNDPARGEISVTLDLEERPSSRKSQSPHLVLKLSVWSLIELVGDDRDVNIDVDYHYHPIVASLHEYSRLVHPRFDRGLSGERTFSFRFATCAKLERLADPVESKGASWEQMQISNPPLKSCTLDMFWYMERRVDRYESCRNEMELKNDTGVTVGQLVEAIRATLADPKDWVNKFGYEFDGTPGYHEYDPSRWY